MHYLKSIICLLIFSCCFFAEVHAQLEVESDGSVLVGPTSYSGRKLKIYNNSKTYGIYTGNYYVSGTSHGLRSYVATSSTGTKAGVSTYVYSSSASSGTVYGLQATVTSSGSGNRYGVYASAPTGTNRYAGYFSGNVHVTGTVSLVAPTPAPNMKMPWTSALDKLGQINAFAYQGKNSRTSYALDTESLKKAFPELVYEVETPVVEAIEGEEGSASKTKTEVNTAVDYNSLIPILVQSIQELQGQVDELKAKLDNK